MTEATSQKQIEEVSLGRFLQLRRQELQMEIDQIAAALRIKSQDLLLIENDQIENLTKRGLYSAGLIRSYAKYLKTNEEEIEKKIANLAFGSNTENKKHMLLNIGEEADITPPKDDFFNFLLISILLFLILLSIYNSFESKTSVITTQDLILKLENAERKYKEQNN